MNEKEKNSKAKQSSSATPKRTYRKRAVTKDKETREKNNNIKTETQADNKTKTRVRQSKAVFRPQFFDKVVSTITKIMDIYDEKLPNAEILSSKLIVDLLTIALTINQSDQQFESALKQKLLAVHNYIDEHFAEDISLEQLSSRFYISKYYLTREYKRIYGKTIFQHIITARINYGKKLLRFSDKTVEQIAQLCGFNDQSYFARQFKKLENLTCFSYRKKWRE